MRESCLGPQKDGLVGLASHHGWVTLLVAVAVVADAAAAAEAKKGFPTRLDLVHPVHPVLPIRRVRRVRRERNRPSCHGLLAEEDQESFVSLAPTVPERPIRGVRAAPLAVVDFPHLSGD